MGELRGQEIQRGTAPTAIVQKGRVSVDFHPRGENIVGHSAGQSDYAKQRGTSLLRRTTY